MQIPGDGELLPLPGRPVLLPPVASRAGPGGAVPRSTQQLHELHRLLRGREAVPPSSPPSLQIAYREPGVLLLDVI